MNDKFFMNAAIKEAIKAAKKGEVPVGAVAVAENKIIARAHNIREAKNNPLGHAEILLIEKIVRKKILPSWRFENVAIYVTCEPCPMCIGAMREARIKDIFYGCGNPSLKNYANYKIKIEGGMLAGECGKLLSDFFKNIR